MKTLILGGVRSGKSVYAENLVLQSKLHAIYIATAKSNNCDSEMLQRIKIHQQRRAQLWQTIEEPIDLEALLQNKMADNNYILVDCLTLWLTNLITGYENLSTHNIEQIKEQQDKLCLMLKKTEGNVVFVSNEVGLGIVPMVPMARQFCDLAGRLQQQMAEVCEQVIFIVAGLPQVLKTTQ